jgi:hypothetical protein
MVKVILNNNAVIPYLISRENTKVPCLDALTDKKFNYRPRLGLATMPSDRQKCRI